MQRTKQCRLKMLAHFSLIANVGLNEDVWRHIGFESYWSVGWWLR